MTTLIIRYPDGPTGPINEQVQAIGPTYDNRYELTSHATLMPIGPGDVVEVDSTGPSFLHPFIVGIASLEKVWTWEVTLHLPAGVTFGKELTSTHPVMMTISELEEEWTRAAWVTRNTAFSFLISSQSQKWFDDNVRSHLYVEHVELVRTPDFQLDFGGALLAPKF